MTADAGWLAFASFIVGVGALLQGSLGFGLSLFAVPFLVMIDPAFVPGPLLVGGATLTLLMTIRDRAALDLPGVGWSTGGRILGSAVGAAALIALPTRDLILAIGALVLVAVALSVSGLRLRPTSRVLLGAGLLSGFMGTTATIAGPPLALAYQNETGDRRRGTLRRDRASCGLRAATRHRDRIPGLGTHASRRRPRLHAAGRAPRRRAGRRGAHHSRARAMSGDPLHFYFDYISHNAYIAWTQIHALAARHGRAVEPRPVLFAGLLNATGQLGPAEIPAKTRWMIRDLLRKAAELGIPFEPPASHPFLPLLPLRVSALPMPEVTRRRLVDALFRATWAESVDVSDPDAVARIADTVGLDGSDTLRAAATSEAKQRLRHQTDEAIAVGVFGVPTVIVDGELFFGYDDHVHVEKFLRGEDPLDREAVAAFARVRATARRRR
jgi:2-hydroxychromene-2-carboxylate isomerase